MSIYSTPVVNLSDHELSSDESLYFTPEVSFSCFTPCRRKNRDTETTYYYGELSPSTLLRSACIQGSILSMHQESRFNGQENSPQLSYESYSTPKKSSVCFTPKRNRSTPLRCISNIVTPVEVKRNIFKFDERLAQVDTEIQSRVNSNTSFNITSISDSSITSNLKTKNRSKCGSKSKSKMLQWLCVPSKSKAEFPFVNENKRKRIELSSSLIKKDESHLMFPVKNYGTICDRKSENSSINHCREHLKSSLSDVNSSNDSRLPLLPKKEKDSLKGKKNTFWNYVKRCRPSLYSRKIHLSPVKRLFLRCRQKLSIQPLTSLFSRDKEPICNNTESFPSKQNTCRCSVTSTLDEEFMNKILSKLNSLECQIKEIKSIVHSKEGVVGSLNIPPPLPPPPPPPLPNIIPIALKQKVNETTPENEQIIKRSARTAETRTQFSITVEDLKSVKLRKTPAATKRPAVNPSTPGTIDGVLRSVKFKPSRRSAMHKKELSHIVADILSPSKKSVQNDNIICSYQSLNDNKENRNLDRYQTTPVKSVNKDAKLHFTKPRDFSWQSSSRRRESSSFKSHIFSDVAPRSSD